MKRKRALSLLVLLAAAAWAEKGRATSVAGDVVTVSVINVEALVTDQQGEPVRGLERDDFELSVDGKPVAVDYFQAPEPAASPARTGDPAAAPVEEPQAEPTHLVVYVDNSELRQASRLRVLRQLEELLLHRLAPEDRVMIVSHDPGLQVRLSWTNDREAMKQAIAQLSNVPVGGDGLDRERSRAFNEVLTLHVAALSDYPPRPCSPEIASPAHAYAQDRRHQVLTSLGALSAVVSSLASTPGPKALLHVSDGLPVMPGADVFEYLYQICGGGMNAGVGQMAAPANPQRGGIGGEIIDPEVAATMVIDTMALGPKAYQGITQAPLDSQSYSVAKQIEGLAAHANSRRVTLYTLQASGLEAMAGRPLTGQAQVVSRFPSIERTDRQGRQDTLFALAKATGGKAILNANDALPDLTEMRRDLGSLYSLGFSFGERGDGSQHRIQVRVKSPGLEVRHREGFRDKTEAERAVDRALAALFWKAEDNPLEIGISVGEVTKSEKDLYLVPVRLRIPLFKLAMLTTADAYEGFVRLVVVTKNADGSLSPIRQVPVPIKIPRKEVLYAMGQYYLYTLSLQLPAGEQRVAVGIRDEKQGLASYLGTDVVVGDAPAAPTPAGASDGR